PSSQPHVQHRLDEGLHPWSAPAVYVAQVPQRGRLTVLDRIPELRGQNLGDVVEGQALRARKQVFGRLMGGRVREDDRRRLADVTRIDERGAPLPRWQVDLLLTNDVRGVGVSEVLGEEPRPQNRPREAR